MATLKQIEDAIYDYTYAQSVGDTPKFSLTQIGELAKTLTESGVTADEINSVRAQAETSAVQKANTFFEDKYKKYTDYFIGAIASADDQIFSSGPWNVYNNTWTAPLSENGLVGKEVLFGYKNGTSEYKAVANVFDEAVKYSRALSGKLTSTVSYDNRHGTVQDIEQSLQNAFAEATKLGISTSRLQAVIGSAAKRQEKGLTQGSSPSAVVKDIFNEAWKPFDIASKIAIPVVSSVWGSVLAGPAGLGLSGATGAAVGGAISGGIKSAILGENLLEGALEGAAVAGLTNVALSATGLDKVLSDAVNKVDETLGISEKTNALLANTPQGVEEANALADLGVSDLGASDVADSVADVDVGGAGAAGAVDLGADPLYGGAYTGFNTAQSYNSLTDYGKDVYAGELALGKSPDAALISAFRAESLNFPTTGNALATGADTAATGNALVSSGGASMAQNLTGAQVARYDDLVASGLPPDVARAQVLQEFGTLDVDAVTGGATTGAVTPTGGVATVDLTAGQAAGQTAGTGTVAGLGTAGTAAGVAGAGAAAGAAGASGQMTAADLEGLDPNLTLGGGTDALGGTDVTGGTGAIVTGAAGGAGAGALTAGGTAAGAAAGLTGIPVVDDFLKYLGTPAGAAALGAFGSLASGYLTGQAAKDAAQIQANAAANALALQREQFEYQKGLLEPYRQAGESALGRLTGVMGLGGQPAQPQQLLDMDPGYAFRLGEGMKALERVQAARGNMLSGGAIKAGQRYAQDFASGEYGNAYNRLANIAGLGQTVGGQLGTAAQQFGQTAGETMSQGANALAAGRINRTSGYMGGVGGAVGAYQNYQNQQQQNQLFGKFLDIYGRAVGAGG